MSLSGRHGRYDDHTVALVYTKSLQQSRLRLRVIMNNRYLRFIKSQPGFYPLIENDPTFEHRIGQRERVVPNVFASLEYATAVFEPHFYMKIL